MQQNPKSSQRIDEFILKYQTQLCKDFDRSKVKCGIISLDELQLAGEYLRRGELVAFPTETVYGLGANALIEDSVRSIFTTKRRPLTDPVIVHLWDAAQIEIYAANKEQIKFGSLFWPGPFTLVIEANHETLPTYQLLSAQTGDVGFRIPNNSIALEILKHAQVPVGAPSANVFAHVSPTSPIHVFNDFYDQPVYIVDGPSSQNGVESTVVKQIDREFRVLRRGSLGVEALIEKVSIHYPGHSVTVSQRLNSENTQCEAPGQLLKHYSPLIPTYIFKTNSQQKLQQINLGKTIIIDFKSRAQSLVEGKDMQFRNLSSEGNIEEAMHNFYDSLRWAENQPIDTILILELEGEDDHTKTLVDKAFRAAAGKYICYVDGDFYTSK